MSNQVSTQAIKSRLEEELTRREISWRAASNKAGRGNGYVQSLLRTETEPTVKAIAELCSANSLDFAYVLLGLSITPEARRLLELSQTDPAKIDHLLALMSD